MNLIRLIKLKKINGELDNLTQIESKFVSYFNNLKYMYTEDTLFNVDDYTQIVYAYGIDNNLYVKIFINSNQTTHYIWLMTWKLNEVDYKYSIKDLDNTFTNFIRIYLGLTNFRCRILSFEKF